MTKRLVIIPARGGSSRIKNKNIKNFFGKPIIFYSIKNALKSKLFKKIHVSTDSKKIIRSLKKINFNVDFMRPKKLASSTTPIYDVINYVTKKYEYQNLQYDEIWCLYPCSPLIVPSDLNKAAKIFKKINNKILISITEYPVPIEWSFKKDKKNNLTFLNKKALVKKSQNLEKKYYDTGNFLIFPRKLVMKNNFFNCKFYGYELTKDKSVDIDDPVDWKISEALYFSLKKNKKIV